MNGENLQRPTPICFDLKLSFCLSSATEIFGVVPEDFMRKHLGDPPNPTQQPREDPFLKECQAANFSGSSDYASMKLNVTQVF